MTMFPNHVQDSRLVLPGCSGINTDSIRRRTIDIPVDDNGAC